MTHNTPSQCFPSLSSFRPGVPPYEEIIFAVKKAIALKRIIPGDDFPSVRAMSRELKLNPNTCQKAVTVLVNEGILEVRPGVGTCVCERPKLDVDEKLKLLDEALEALVVEARQLGLTQTELKEAIAKRWRELE